MKKMPTNNGALSTSSQNARAVSAAPLSAGEAALSSLLVIFCKAPGGKPLTLRRLGDGRPHPGKHQFVGDVQGGVGQGDRSGESRGGA